ncbi:MAG: undecaprenyl-phosphate glucose phosphotransferase [Bauldia sp.]|nr:undecaprenyl-phosphate glucose phosphotransferase [Bauldia sp.]
MNAAARAAASALSRAAVSPVLLAGVARLVEFLGALACGAAIYLVYVATHDGFDWWYALPLVAGAFLAVLFIEAAKGYAMPALRRGAMTLGRVFLAWTAVFALFAVAAFLAKSGDDYSRVWVASWYLAGLVVFTSVRLTLASLIRVWTKAGMLERRAVIVGGGQTAEELIRALEVQPDNDIRICGIFDDRKDDRSPAMIAGYPKLGTIAELVEFGRITRIDLLIVSLPITAESRLLQMLGHLWVLPVDIRLSAHTNKLRFRPRSYSFIGSLPFLDVFDKPIADWDYLLKRAFDLVFASLALVLLSPLMLATAIAIRLDSRGPILFRQKRYGFNNELIEVYKFRSMYVDQTDANAARLVTRDDPRVTRVGSFIRKTSIDELPQLFNVLFRGNLSLVGPRPHALQAKAENRLYDEVVDGYFARHRVKPGITGWAQISGWRGETDTAEKIQQRVAHDLYYIENWSVPFDLKICFLTPFRLFDRERAY